jgi:hypothetical protein
MTVLLTACISLRLLGRQRLLLLPVGMLSIWLLLGVGEVVVVNLELTMAAVEARAAY